MHPDYSTPIADHFLKERAQLDAALLSVRSLADESLALHPAAAHLREVQARLQRPFVFLAVGEASSGKSALLNALFGREFSDPDAQRTSVFQFGEEISDVPLNSRVVERRRPLAFLRDFQLVDTAAASAILADPDGSLDRLAAGADLILFAVSVMDPWNEGAWDFIKAVYKTHGREIVIVVQHADERPTLEVDAICRHVERMAFSRLGREFPVCPVSARSALLARTSGLDRARLWRDSGFARLEAHIDSTLGGCRGRGADLPAAAVQGRAVLRDIALDVRRLARDVGAESAAIALAQETIARAEAACRAEIEALREGLQTVAHRCGRQGENLLRRRTRQGWCHELFAGARATPGWARSFHRRCTALVQAGAAKQVTHALNAMIVHYQAAADRLLAACQQAEAIAGVAPHRKAAQEVSARCGQLVEEVDLTLVEHLAGDRVESRVQAALDRSAKCCRWAARLAGTAWGAAAGAALWGALGVSIGAAVTGMLGAAFALARASEARDEALACYQKETPQVFTALIAAVETAFATAADDCGAHLREALEPVGAHCARRAERVAPICDQVEGLENLLGRLASRGAGA